MGESIPVRGVPVKSGGNFLKPSPVNTKQIDGVDLPKLIHKKIGHEPHLVVVLHTDSDTKYGAFFRAPGSTNITIELLCILI